MEELPILPPTHRQLVSVEVMWPAQTLPLPLQQGSRSIESGRNARSKIIIHEPTGPAGVA